MTLQSKQVTRPQSPYLQCIKLKRKSIKFKLPLPAHLHHRHLLLELLLQLLRHPVGVLLGLAQLIVQVREEADAALAVGAVRAHLRTVG